MRIPLRSPEIARAVLVAGVLVCVVLLPSNAAAIQEPPGAAEAMAVGPRIAPLPFQGEEEIKAFLLEAEVLESEPIGIGIADARKVELGRDGVRLTAVFRAVDEIHERIRLSDGRFFQRLRDFCGFEVVAYEIGRLLGMDNIPVTVARRVDGDLGTVQLWVPEAMMEQDRLEAELRSPDPIGWRRQTQEMALFDQLIGNIDRHAGNVLVDTDWKIWLIDHTRGFQQGDHVEGLEGVTWVRRGFWEGLRSLEPEALPDPVHRFLDRRELDDLFTRRTQILRHIETLISERGPGAVLYE